MTLLILNRERHGIIPYSELLGSVGYRLAHMLSEHAGFEQDCASVEVFDDFRSNGMVEKRGYEIIDSCKISAVVATSEYDLLRAARLREYAGVPGQGIVSAHAFRDKITMKDLARDVVDVPDAYVRLQNVGDIHRFIKNNGYPVVLKPVDGAGSINTTIIRDAIQLEAAISSLDVVGYEMETFVDGSMYVVDGLVHDGRLAFSWASRYVDDCLSFKEGRGASVVQLDPSDALNARLHTFASALLSAMPTPETTTFHLEVFHTTEDRLVLCEIASRTGGGAINELGKQRFGVDMHAIWMRKQAGGHIAGGDVVGNDTGVLFGFAQISPRAGLRARPPLAVPFDFVTKYQIEGNASNVAHAVRESSDKIATIVVRGACSREVEDRLQVSSDWMLSRCYQ